MNAPFYVRYELNRRQRMLPHLKIWGPLGLMAGVGLAVFVGLLASLSRSWWLELFVFVWLWLCRGFFLGLLDVVVRPVVQMDLLVEDNGLGVMSGGQRYWLFLDGIVSIEQRMPGFWTVQHWNRAVINIPTEAITEEQLEHLRAGMRRGQEYRRSLAERGSVQ